MCQEVSDNLNYFDKIFIIQRRAIYSLGPKVSNLRFWRGVCLAKPLKLLRGASTFPSFLQLLDKYTNLDSRIFKSSRQHSSVDSFKIHVIMFLTMRSVP